MPSEADTCPGELTGLGRSRLEVENLQRRIAIKQTFRDIMIEQHEDEVASLQKLLGQEREATQRISARLVKEGDSLPRNLSDYTLAILAAETVEDLDELEEQADAHFDIAKQETHMLAGIVGKIRMRRVALEATP